MCILYCPLLVDVPATQQLQECCCQLNEGADSSAYHCCFAYNILQSLLLLLC